MHCSYCVRSFGDSLHWNFCHSFAPPTASYFERYLILFELFQKNLRSHNLNSKDNTVKISLFKMLETQQSNPDLTVSLTIPFVLVGSTTVPEYVWTWAQPYLPMEVMHAMLTKNNPDIPLALELPNFESVRKRSQADIPHISKKNPTHRDDNNDNDIPKAKVKIQSPSWAWTLSKGTSSLTTEESSLLPKASFIIPLQLTSPAFPYFNTAWREQLTSLLSILSSHFNDPDPNFPFQVIVNRNTRLTLEISPGEAWVKENGGWGLETCRKVLTSLVGWERELHSVGSVTACSAFIPLSRGLRIWRRRAIFGAMKKARRVLGWKEEKWNEWLVAFSAEISLSDEKEGEREGIWDSFDRMGDQELVDMLAFLNGRQNIGVMMTVKETPPGAHFLHSLAAAENKRTQDYDTPPPPTEVFPELNPPEIPIAAIPSITFPFFRSILDADTIAAFVDLYALVVDYCFWIEERELAEQLSSFRRSRGKRVPKSTSRDDVLDMLSVLQIPTHSPVHTYYSDLLTHPTPDPSHISTISKLDPATGGPWAEIVSAIERRRREDYEGLRVYMARYDEAGGFDVPSKSKLLKQVLRQHREALEKMAGKDRRDVTAAERAREFVEAQKLKLRLGVDDDGQDENGEGAGGLNLRIDADVRSVGGRNGGKEESKKDEQKIKAHATRAETPRHDKHGRPILLSLILSNRGTKHVHKGKTVSLKDDASPSQK
ncbi:hypothetical protein GQ43DRAFT_53061 [Delitschia confertaspora ATCC 74209]|uniref:Uncharacterized protein n=1 Tax=Delitschia confertaspora ATCC 74209 TaxID=1513339 RepID=A0A9P4JPY5_9PLEO|nr:hypothetical protein GQ43DRAFT_53061 [Delitschia confertaspora ATCC 74209]